jgi:hypothetical protein
MSSVATTTVYYTVDIPTNVGSSISGSFSIIYNTIDNTGTVNSLNITTPSGSFTDEFSCTFYSHLGYGYDYYDHNLSLYNTEGTANIIFKDLILDDSSTQFIRAFGEVSPPNHLSYSSTGGTMSSSLTAPSCFTLGTLISTPIGSTPVQDLQIGDLILNNVGQSVRVKWIGTQQLHPAFARDHLPIRIHAAALGHDLPLRDLYVSPCHALYIDHCLLVQAKALVNGISITQMTQWEGDLLYLHIETEHHEIILAEGAPTETFMENISRACFNNYSEYKSLYPEAHEMMELDLPRVCHQRQLPNMVKRKLEEIAEGFKVSSFTTFLVSNKNH